MFVLVATRLLLLALAMLLSEVFRSWFLSDPISSSRLDSPLLLSISPTVKSANITNNQRPDSDHTSCDTSSHSMTLAIAQLFTCPFHFCVRNMSSPSKQLLLKSFVVSASRPWSSTHAASCSGPGARNAHGRGGGRVISSWTNPR